MSEDFDDAVKRALEQQKREKDNESQASEDTKRKGRDMKITLDKKDTKNDK